MDFLSLQNTLEEVCICFLDKIYLFFQKGIFKTNFDDLQYLVYDTDDEEEDARKELFDDDDDDFDEN